jgi:hypothetical protein
MVPSEAYAGRRAGYERVLMPKEERNKWTAWRVLRVYAVVPCSLFRHKPKLYQRLMRK